MSLARKSRLRSPSRYSPARRRALGYFDNQIATEASFNRDGWFLSGDIGILDERGNLRIEGRLKDLIIRGGHNISPAHIEALALRCHAIERAACFPVSDERLGERVIAGSCTSHDLDVNLPVGNADGGKPPIPP